VDERPPWKRLRDGPLVLFISIVLGDFLRLVVVWILLYVFHLLPTYMPVPGFAGRFIEGVHQVGSIAVASLLVWFLIIDVIQSRRVKK
jgi:hypothetical protein